MDRDFCQFRGIYGHASVQSGDIDFTGHPNLHSRSCVLPVRLLLQRIVDRPRVSRSLELHSEHLLRIAKQRARVRLFRIQARCCFRNRRSVLLRQFRCRRKSRCGTDSPRGRDRCFSEKPRQRGTYGYLGQERSGINDDQE